MFPALRFVCGMNFPTLCLTPDRWMSLRVQSIVGCLPELRFYSIFSVAQVPVGLRNQFMNKILFFTFGTVLLVLLMRIIITIIIKQYKVVIIKNLIVFYNPNNLKFTSI